MINIYCQLSKWFLTRCVQSNRLKRWDEYNNLDTKKKKKFTIEQVL